MSNLDSSTPSIQALNLAVKPAGYDSWEKFEQNTCSSAAVDIALAYAADLDKADKVGRMMLNDTRTPDCMPKVLLEKARSMLLPDPIDPDLLEAREIMAQDCTLRNGSEASIADIREGGWDDTPTGRLTLAALRRGRELAKERGE